MVTMTPSWILQLRHQIPNPRKMKGRWNREATMLILMTMMLRQYSQQQDLEESQLTGEQIDL